MSPNRGMSPARSVPAAAAATAADTRAEAVGVGRALLTVRGRPLRLRPLMAFSASSLFDISTKPKPRDSPENLSLMIEELETSPNAAKASLRTAPWECLSAQRRKKVFDCQSSPGDKGPQGPPCDFGMVGNRESRDMSFLRQNDMASLLTGNVPAQFPKGFHDFARL